MHLEMQAEKRPGACGLSSGRRTVRLAGGGRCAPAPQRPLLDAAIRPAWAVPRPDWARAKLTGGGTADSQRLGGAGRLQCQLCWCQPRLVSAALAHAPRCSSLAGWMSCLNGLCRLSQLPIDFGVKFLYILSIESEPLGARVSASCMLVRVARHGRSWRASAQSGLATGGICMPASGGGGGSGVGSGAK